MDSRRDDDDSQEVVDGEMVGRGEEGEGEMLACCSSQDDKKPLTFAVPFHDLRKMGTKVLMCLTCMMATM